MDQRLAGITPVISCTRCKLREDLLGNLLRITANTNRHRLCQPDSVWVDINLNDLRRLRPVINAIPRQCRKRIQPCAEREHDIRFRNQFHRGLRAIIAERTRRQTVATGKAVIVLVIAANRSIKPFSERRAIRNSVTEHNARAR